MDGSEEDKVASSANRSTMIVFIDIGKSLMYIRKSKGPRTDPWGTPAVICFGSDSLPETFRDCHTERYRHKENPSDHLQPLFWLLLGDLNFPS